MGKHDMRDHIDVDEVIKNLTNFEDIDSFLVVGRGEQGGIVVNKYWLDEFKEAPTLLEALYLLFPECYCNEN